jgi:hypothetical protein
MRKLALLSFVLGLCFAFVQAADPAHSFVGVKACTPCHKTEKQGKQVPIWQGSEHAKAFQTLKSPEAQKVAEKAGVKGPAVESEKCLKCHVAGAGLPATAFRPTFVKEDGVQCENCHGAGSDYKTIAAMKDKAKAIAAGLTPLSLKDGSAEKLCKSCHNPESPTFKSFNFKEAWPKIAHPVPKA